MIKKDFQIYGLFSVSEKDRGTKAIYEFLGLKESQFQILTDDSTFQPNSLVSVIFTFDDHHSQFRSRIEAYRNSILKSGHWNKQSIFILPILPANRATQKKGRRTYDYHIEGPLKNKLLELTNMPPGPILLQGEVGTGKTELARHIHQASGRSLEKFGEINPKMYGNSTSTYFYGVVDNYFTGVKGRESEFKKYDGGTILIDDFQDLSEEDQIALLALLDPFTNRVSASKLGQRNLEEWQSDVQVILAINRPASELIHANKLRRDLNSRVQKSIGLDSISKAITLVKSKKFGTLEIETFFRSKIIQIQERALSQFLQFGYNNFLKHNKQKRDSATNRLEYILDFLIGNSSGSEVNEIMPVDDTIINYPFFANYRDLEDIGRKLLYSEKSIGRWKRGAYHPIIKEKIERYECKRPEQETTDSKNIPPSSISPKEHIHAALIAAISKPDSNISTITKDLNVDKRTATKLIQSISESNSNSDQNWWTAGMTAEQFDIVKSASKSIIKYPYMSGMMSPLLF